MISDDDVKRLYRFCQKKLAEYPDSGEPLRSQFFRGVGPRFWEGQHPGACQRHMSVFSRFNIIPEYCFGCYKVFIEPRTVVELFKLMMIFEQLRLPKDNNRKCMVELREQVSGAYKGFVYCRGIDEGRRMLDFIRQIVSREIADGVPVTLKRGCTEYALVYPDYAPKDPDTGGMEYDPDWRALEERADREQVFDDNRTMNRTHNPPTYTLQDARIMFGWLQYAAMIGDRSYLELSGRELAVTSNVKRPGPFRQASDAQGD